MAANCILISDQPIDRKLCETLAARLSIDLVIAPLTIDRGALGALAEEGRSFLFWDVSPTEAAQTIPRDNLAKLLPKLLPPEHVFLLADTPWNAANPFVHGSFFGHYLFRSTDLKFTDFLCRIVQCAMQDRWIDLHAALPGGDALKGITLKSSGERDAALAAVQNLLKKRDVHPRVAALLVQGVDELLMNALFDAPTKGDRHYRNHLDRGAKFPLEGNEQVELQMSFDDEYVGLSVTDRFGSLERATVERLLWKDYRRNDYVVREDKSGAGLGIHGVVSSGACLMFVIRPGALTRALVYVPNSRNYRAFRKGFQILSFVFDRGPGGTQPPA